MFIQVFILFMSLLTQNKHMNTQQIVTIFWKHASLFSNDLHNSLEYDDSDKLYQRMANFLNYA